MGIKQSLSRAWRGVISIFVPLPAAHARQFPERGSLLDRFPPHR